MLSAVRGSRAAPSPSIATVTPSASDATTSLWSAHARPSASNPGPRLADVAGTLTWTRTRLEPLEEPVGGERDGPGVEDDVIVGEDEHAHHDQDQARRPRGPNRGADPRPVGRPPQAAGPPPARASGRPSAAVARATRRPRRCRGRRRRSALRRRAGSTRGSRAETGPPR